MTPAADPPGPRHRPGPPVREGLSSARKSSSFHDRKERHLNAAESSQQQRRRSSASGEKDGRTPLPDDRVLARMRGEFVKMQRLQAEQTRRMEEYNMMLMESRQRDQQQSRGGGGDSTCWPGGGSNRSGGGGVSSIDHSNRSGGLGGSSIDHSNNSRGSYGSDNQSMFGGGSGRGSGSVASSNTCHSWDIQDEYLKMQRLLLQRDQLARITAQQQQQIAANLLGDSGPLPIDAGFDIHALGGEQQRGDGTDRLPRKQQQQQQCNSYPRLQNRDDRTPRDEAFNRQFHPPATLSPGGCDDRTVFTRTSLGSNSMSTMDMSGFTWNNSNISNDMPSSFGGGYGAIGGVSGLASNMNNHNNISMSHNLGGRGGVGGGGYSQSLSKNHMESSLERKLEKVKEKQRRLEQLQELQRMHQEQQALLLQHQQHQQQQQQQMMMIPQAQTKAMQQMQLMRQLQNHDNDAINSSRDLFQGEIKSSFNAPGINAIEGGASFLGMGGDAQAQESFKMSNLDLSETFKMSHLELSGMSGMDMSLFSITDPVCKPSPIEGVVPPPENNKFRLDNEMRPGKKEGDEDEVDALPRTTTTTNNNHNGGVGRSGKDNARHHQQEGSSFPSSVAAKQKPLRRKTSSSISQSYHDNEAINSSRDLFQGEIKSSFNASDINAIEGGASFLVMGGDAQAQESFKESFKMSNLDLSETFKMSHLELSGMSGMDMSLFSITDPVCKPSPIEGVVPPPENNKFRLDNEMRPGKKEGDEDEVDALPRTTITKNNNHNGGVGRSGKDKARHHQQGGSSFPSSVAAKQKPLRRQTSSSILEDDDFHESFKSLEVSDRLLQEHATSNTKGGQKKRGRLPDPDGAVLCTRGVRKDRGGGKLGTIHSSRAPSSSTTSGMAAAAAPPNDARLSSEGNRRRDGHIRSHSNESMCISDPDFGISITSLKSFQSSSAHDSNNSSSHWLSHYKSMDSIENDQFDPWDEEDSAVRSSHDGSDDSMSAISAPRMVSASGGNR